MDYNSLWKAIYSLFKLLLYRENKEALYQNYFERNPIVFQVLGYDSFQSYEKQSKVNLPFDEERGFKPEPDFLCGTYKSSKVTIFELKTPFVEPAIVERKDGARKKLNAKLESYLSQSTEYVESIRERQDSREIVMENLNLESISSYDIKVIYGCKEDNKPSSVSRLLSNRKIPTEIIYFDELLNTLIDTYAFVRSNTQNRNGLSVIYHLTVLKNQRHKKAYIADHGTESFNRISIYLEDENIAYECIDSSQVSHQLKAKLIYDTPIFLRFEFSNDEKGIYMSLNVNNEEKDIRLGSTAFNLELDIKNMIIGADISGNNGACFKMHESYYVTKTLDIKAKLNTYDYFERKIAESEACILFNGDTFLIREPSGNLTQPDPPKRPKHIK